MMQTAIDGSANRSGGDAAQATADAVELARFGALSAEAWWNPQGEMAGLHAINPARLSFLRDRICRHFGRDPAVPRPLAGLRMIDIGCGGGLLSEPLARMGAEVTGLDAAPEAIAVARAHAAAAGLEIRYEAAEAADLVRRGLTFDAVLAMEIVEHVAAPQAFLADCAALVRPGGFFAAATLSRTLRAFGMAILGAEYLLRLVPPGTHDWRRFLKPHELARMMRHAGIGLTDTAGISYDPVSRGWRLSRDLSVNYLICGSRPA